MPLAINLLKNRHTLSEKEYQKERLYYRYAIFAAVAAAIITVAVSIWQFVLTTQLNKLDLSISKSNKELAGMAEANAKQVYLKSRLNLITSFLDDRSVARQSLQKIFSISIPGVSISGASFKSDSVLYVQATAENVFGLDEFIKFLRGDDFFLQAVTEGVTRQQDGKYQMDVLLTIPKG